MKSRFAQLIGLALALWLVGSVLSGCQPIRAEPSVQGSALSEEEEFVKAAMGVELAYQSNDIDATLAYYADDAISQPPGFRTDVGKDAIRASYQAYFDAYEMKRDFKLAGVKIEGNTATRFGEWTQVSIPKDGSEPITEVGRCVVGFKKVDGQWKVAWEIWNTFDPE